MQLEEETAECLPCIFDMCSTSDCFKLNQNVYKVVSSIVTIYCALPSSYSTIGAIPWR